MYNGLLYCLFKQFLCYFKFRLQNSCQIMKMFQANETIRYLEFCVSSMNVQEQAIHNYLLSLYAQHKPDRLMRYLAMEGESSVQSCVQDLNK